MAIKKHMNLDQYYTNTAAAEHCYHHLLGFLKHANIHKTHFIEPSAGDGAFFDLLPKGKRTGIDLEPNHRLIKQGDFLAWTPSSYVKKTVKQNRVFIGNPPFGKRGKLAVHFFNRAALFADTVAFILPIVFCKYCMHRQMMPDMRLVARHKIPLESFRLPTGKSFAVNAEFQIWTRLRTKHLNLRRLMPTPITHPDFLLHQYNNTITARKVFDLPFNLAVPCQGYQDYNRREVDEKQCERNKQWMLFSAQPKIIDRIYNLNFEALAMRYTTTIPGFRKCDVVEEYTKTYE